MSAIYHCPNCDHLLEIKEFPEGDSPLDPVGNDVCLRCQHCGQDFKGIEYPTLREAWHHALHFLELAKKRQWILRGWL